MTERQEKMNELLRQLAANYIETESNGTTLISVTHVDVSPDMKQAHLYITVLPEDKEEFALNFVKRRLKDMRISIRSKMSTKVTPFFDVALDMGEKNRQKIDRLLRE